VTARGEYAGGPGMGYAAWVEEQTPAGQRRARQAADDDALVGAFLRYEKRCRERAALAVWAATPEGQETAARARMIGLFDQVSASSGPTPLDAGARRASEGPSKTTVVILSVRHPRLLERQQEPRLGRTALPPPDRGPARGPGGAGGGRNK